MTRSRPDDGARRAATPWCAIVFLVSAWATGWPAADAAAQGSPNPDLLRPVWIEAGDSVSPDATTPRENAHIAGRSFLLSALVPGAGQWSLGTQRWVPYVAVEAWAWITYFEQRADRRNLERQYRDLAWAVARRVSIGDRRDGEWDYYEAMGKYHASGAYDADPRTPGIQPDLDESTYNGSMWRLARAIHIPRGAVVSEDSPEYQNALDYYARRAIPPEMAWSWGDNGLEQQVFRELIRDGDDAFRKATRALGVVLANHVISAVDALVTARLREAGADTRVDWRLRGSLVPDAESGALWAVVSMRPPWGTPEMRR